jgi:hypothetical protein
MHDVASVVLLLAWRRKSSVMVSAVIDFLDVAEFNPSIRLQAYLG